MAMVVTVRACLMGPGGDNGVSCVLQFGGQGGKAAASCCEILNGDVAEEHRDD